eukprot:gene8887-8975_t
MRVLVAGGGIGGLTLALMLEARGISCTVFEAAAEVRPLGVGINTLPHSIRELAALGLLDALDATGIRTRKLTYMNQMGQTIWEDARGLHAGHDVPQFSIHRGQLHALLWRRALEVLGPERVRAGHRLAGFEQSAEGVVARFERLDGGVVAEHGAVLVGADGIHSWLRTHLHPDDGGIRWNGIQMWRGAVDWPVFDGGDAMVIAGDGTAKLVLYPIGAGETAATRLTNWVIYARVADGATPPPGRESWSRRADLAAFRHLSDRLSLDFVDVTGLIEATADVFEYPMCDRDPLPGWTQGRVTLLGDAAHPMYPVGSNGASQAILDARCLADRLAEMAAVPALAAYEAERLPATRDIVLSNRTGGPERVIDLVAARAPDGYRDVSEVADRATLEAVVRGYAALAGFALVQKVPYAGGVEQDVGVVHQAIELVQLDCIPWFRRRGEQPVMSSLQGNQVPPRHVVTSPNHGTQVRKGLLIMDKDRIEGAANQAKGAIKEGFGKLTGDAKTEAEGNAEKNAGKVQNAIGGAKDTVRDAVNK